MSYLGNTVLITLAILIGINTSALYSSEEISVFSLPFDDYKYLIQINGSMGPAGGQILDLESGPSFEVSDDDGNISQSSPEFITYTVGISGEMLMDNFGIILEYDFLSLNEGQSEVVTLSGNFIVGNCFYTGINYHIPFFDNVTPGSFYFGVKAGFITGTLTPYVTYDQYLGSNPTTINLTGFSVCPELGINCLINHFIFGLTLSYYLDYLTAGENLANFYNYSGNAFSINYLTIGISIGAGF
ncbi:MAG: hypothetical protein ABSG94_02085 [Brevinematales bacterium]